MPSRSTLMAVVWSLGALAVVSRIPQARALVLGS